MTIEHIHKHILRKRSFLCVGLDIDLNKVPQQYNNIDGLFAFAKIIIDTTHELCVAYKPNLAFYEAYGAAGWAAFEKTVKYIKSEYPDHFVIADAKRGDIGNTSGRYAKAFYETAGCDSVTIAPYMGADSVEPFLEHEGKYAILLALTSNVGSKDFQRLSTDQDTVLYEQVILQSRKYKNFERLMYVVGATQASTIKYIRSLVPDSFLLVPGVGAQGGNLADVFQNGRNEQIGLLVNSSRSILYAGDDSNFREAAYAEARRLQIEMSDLMG